MIVVELLDNLALVDGVVLGNLVLDVEKLLGKLVLPVEVVLGNLVLNMEEEALFEEQLPVEDVDNNQLHMVVVHHMPFEEVVGRTSVAVDYT